MEEYNIRAHQLIELKALKYVSQICRDHNIRYFLIGGTLLGAVRHKGFIPWDDDIDIGMPRGDYERFIEIAQSKLSQDYFLQTYNTDPGYPMGFAKLRDNKTLFVEEAICHLDINHGIYIDIFPLDGVPGNKLIRKIQSIAKVIFENTIWVKINPNCEVQRNITYAAYRIISKLFSLRQLRRFVDMTVKLCRFDEEEYIGNFFGAWGKREIVPRAFFAESVQLKFEDDLFEAPLEYDKYLRCIYGNYMELPPVEKRVSHHNATKVSLNDKCYRSI